MQIKLLSLLITSLLPYSLWAQYSVGFSERGVISYYPTKFNRTTASGELFDSKELVAGHKKIPFNSLVKITNLNNGKTVIVRINDRGPYAYGRVMDISEAAARKIDLLATGTAKAEIEVIGDGKGTLAKDKDKLKEREPDENPRVTASNEGSFATGRSYTHTAVLKIPKGFTHQIGSFNELSKAIEHCKMLEYRGFKNDKIFIYVASEKTKKVYKVFVGEFENKIEGDKLKTLLEVTLGRQVWTRPHPDQP